MNRNSTAAPRKDPKTGAWFFVVDVGSSPDGKRRQVFRRGFATKRQAQEELDKVRGQGRTNRYVPPAKLTVPESVAKVFDRRVARLGLRRLRFHDLRHTHVAHPIAAKQQPLKIAKRLGHASAAFTQDRYGHLFEDADSQAVAAVAAMVDEAR